MLALAFVVFLCFVAIFAPAIAGTKPIVCKYKGSIYFPCMGYFKRSWENPIFFQDRFRGNYAKNLKEKDPESWAIWPLVYQDPYRRVYEGEWPGQPGNPSGTEGEPSRWNWFGTNQEGLDVFAQMVHGTQIALSRRLCFDGHCGRDRHHAWCARRLLGRLGRHARQPVDRARDVHSVASADSGARRDAR